MSKKLLFTTITFIIVLIIVETLSYYGLRYLSVKKGLYYEKLAIRELSQEHINRIHKVLNREERLVAFHPSLGWSLKPNASYDIYQINSQGLRANRDYPKSPSSDSVRIATFGDSFVFCDEVNNTETWQHFLEKNDPKIEALNFGVPGYGTDQSLLRYLEFGTKFEPHIVLIGFMQDNIYRNVNTFRPFYAHGTRLPLTKPRYIVSKNDVELVENPLSSLNDYKLLLNDQKKTFAKIGKHDFIYQLRNKRSFLDISNTVRLVKTHSYAKNAAAAFLGKNHVYDTKKKPFIVSSRVLKKFYDTVKKNGATPVIVILPNKGELLRYKLYNSNTFDPLITYFQNNNIAYIDLTKDFASHNDNPRDYSRYFVSGSHFSAEGNALVAQFLRKHLEDRINEWRNRR